jgi:hypothetical protein
VEVEVALETAELVVAELAVFFTIQNIQLQPVQLTQLLLATVV